jgi:hypothetical protein
MAGRCLRCTASLIFLMTVLVGSGPLYAQRHDADEFAPLRGEAGELYSQDKPRPFHSRSGTSLLFITATGEGTGSSRLLLACWPPSITAKP